MNMDEIKIKINGIEVSGKNGQNVLQVARENGFEIPALCYHPHLSVVGSCRLCAVEVGGTPGVQMACSLKLQEGMEVTTESEQISQTRKSVLELLLMKYYDDGYAKDDRLETEFEHWLNLYNIKRPGWVKEKPWVQIDSDDNPFVWVDMNKCILCTRCVRVCTEIQGSFVWGIKQRGANAHIVAGVDQAMLEAGCESCGLCVQVCPTGALEDRPSVGSGIPEKVVNTTCTFCGVGCQLALHVKDNKITRVTVKDDGPVNGIALCVKGRYGYQFVHHPDRLKKPRVRKYLLEGKNRPGAGDRGEWVEVDWDTALSITAKKFVEIKQQSGSNAIGVLASAKCTNEENYLFQKFARQVIGTHSIDHCARL